MPQNSSDNPIPPGLPKPTRKPGILPLPAGQASPSILRAVEELRRLDPVTAAGVIPKEMDWMDPEAFSNVLGYANIDNRNEININPALPMVRPQDNINRTVAHEAKHLRQYREADGDDLAIMAAANRLVPYNERTHEQEAFKYADELFPHTYPKDIKEWHRQSDMMNGLLGLFLMPDEFKGRK